MKNTFQRHRQTRLSLLVGVVSLGIVGLAAGMAGIVPTINSSHGTCTSLSSGGDMFECDIGTLQPGESAVVTVNTVGTMPGMITNVADVSGGQPDPNLENNSDSAMVTVSGEGVVDDSVDLSVTKSANPDPVAIGAKLAYILTVTNESGNKASGVTLLDRLPLASKFLSVSSSQGTCAGAGGSVSCDLGTLGPGASAQVTIMAEPTAVGFINNRASVASEQADSDESDNSVAILSEVRQRSADLRVVKDADADEVDLNSDIGFTITITNNGPDAAEGVSLVDSLLVGGD